MFRCALLVALLACKGEPARRVRDDARPTESAQRSGEPQARLLRYRSSELPRYQLVATASTPPGSVVPLDLARTITLELAAIDERHLAVRILDDAELAGVVAPEITRTASALVFPELLAKEVAAGERWSVSRRITVPGSERPIELSHELTYVGEANCPGQASGTRRCAQLALAAPARNAIVRADGATWMIVYRGSGTIYLDVERGIAIESRLRVDGNVANGPMSVTVSATVVATPIDARE